MEDSQRVTNGYGRAGGYDAMPRHGGLASTQFRRGVAVPESVSDVSSYNARDRFYKAVATVVDGARVVEASNECVFALDDQLQAARERGQSPLALAIVEQNLMTYGYAVNIFAEHYVTRGLRRY